MTLQNFNVFGRVRVDRTSIQVAYSSFNGRKRGTPINITSDEEISEIPEGKNGEFLFGLSVTKDNYEPFVYVTEPVDSIEIETLPVVKKYLDLVSESIQKLEQLTS
jgi:hypothetical protein